MADNTKIEWTDATVNAVNGCTVTSPGCTNCYAMRLAGTRMKDHPSRAGLTIPTKAGPVWTGEVRLNETQLLQPLAWKRPRRIFWNAHGDLFHPNVPDAWIDRCFASMALTPQHIHQVLTKRSARMRAYMNELRESGRYLLWQHLLSPGVPFSAFHKTWELLFANVHLGVSVEDQARADERIPDLLATPAAVRWISAEPLLGPVDLTQIPLFDSDPGDEVIPTLSALEISPLFAEYGFGDTKLDWVIVGGESGPGARPMDNEWAQSLVDQCRAASVPVFVKQLSSGGPKAIKDMALFPEGLRVREWPE